ncbi:MAG: hypothetical protein KDD69_18710 [Bdellovibrionales bacterium]|nr:hypothetical protein [Bdellovibrionales bacterium]
MEAAGLEAAATSTSRSETEPTAVTVLTMELAKGLEFRAVAVIACDDDILPLRSPIPLSEMTLTWRRSIQRSDIFYMSPAPALATRLIVTGVSPASEFLEDSKL